MTTTSVPLVVQQRDVPAVIRSLTTIASPDYVDRWLAWAAVVAALANIGALGGIFSLSGPLNAGNGVIGGIAAPLFAWVLWILLASAWMLTRSPAGDEVSEVGLLIMWLDPPVDLFRRTPAEGVS